MGILEWVDGLSNRESVFYIIWFAGVALSIMYIRATRIILRLRRELRDLKAESTEES